MATAGGRRGAGDLLLETAMCAVLRRGVWISASDQHLENGQVLPREVELLFGRRVVQKSYASGRRGRGHRRHWHGARAIASL